MVVKIEAQINQTHIVLIYPLHLRHNIFVKQKVSHRFRKNALLSFNQAIVLTNMCFNTQQKTKFVL